MKIFCCFIFELGKYPILSGGSYYRTFPYISKIKRHTAWCHLNAHHAFSHCQHIYIPPYTSTSHKVSVLEYFILLLILTKRPTEPRRHPMCLVSFVLRAALTFSHTVATEDFDNSCSMTKSYKSPPVNSSTTYMSLQSLCVARQLCQ